MTTAPLFTHCTAHNTITRGGRPCPQCAQAEEIKALRSQLLRLNIEPIQAEEIKTLRAALKSAEREAASLRRRIRIIHSWTKP